MPAAALVGGSLISSVVGGLGASKAAGQQAAAAQAGINAVNEGAKKSSDFQTNEWQQQQDRLNPYVNSGTGALSTLSGMLSTPGQGLLQGYGDFTAPTMEQAENMPGYKFQLQQGTEAINRNAAANGTLLSGNTGKALTDYGQGLASTSYNNLYNQALQAYNTNFNTFNTNQNNQYSRLGTLANMGQNAATTLGSEGQAAAGNLAGIYGNQGSTIAQLLGQKGAAQASGTVGMTNAITGGIGSLSTLPALSQLYNGGGSSMPATGGFDSSGAAWMNQPWQPGPAMAY